MTPKPPGAGERLIAEADAAGRSRRLRWRRAGEGEMLPDDPVLWSWLSDPGSLTGRLRRQGGAGFRLEVLDEGREEATAEDSEHLACDDPQMYVRRVRMSCDGVRLVAASTRVPAATLARHPWLAALRDRPLGEALADQEDVSRTPFEYAWITVGDALLEQALAGTDIAPHGLWARRSSFLIQGDPILVYEVFLPGLSRFGNG